MTDIKSRHHFRVAVNDIHSNPIWDERWDDKTQKVELAERIATIQRAFRSFIQKKPRWYQFWKLPVYNTIKEFDEFINEN